MFGANINSLNTQKNTPADIANHYGQDSIVNCIVDLWFNAWLEVLPYKQTESVIVLQEIIEFLQVRGGYLGEYGKQRALHATRLGRNPTDEPLESLPVRLKPLTGWYLNNLVSIDNVKNT